jgi:hypothetical protein
MLTVASEPRRTPAGARIISNVKKRQGPFQAESNAPWVDVKVMRATARPRGGWRCRWPAAIGFPAQRLQAIEACCQGDGFTCSSKGSPALIRVRLILVVKNLWDRAEVMWALCVGYP